MGHPSSPEAIMPGTPSYLLTEIRMRRAEEEITWIIKNCTGTVLTRSDLSPWGVFIFGVAVSTITANRDSWIEWVLQGTSFCYKHTAGKLEGQELGLKTPVLVKKTTMEIIAQNTAQLSLSNPLNGNIPWQCPQLRTECFRVWSSLYFHPVTWFFCVALRESTEAYCRALQIVLPYPETHLSRLNPPPNPVMGPLDMGVSVSAKKENWKVSTYFENTI